MLVFEERGKQEYPEKKLSEQSREKQQQTQPTYDAGSGNRTQEDAFVESDRSYVPVKSKLQHPPPGDPLGI